MTSSISMPTVANIENPPSLSVVLSFANEEAVLPSAIHRLRSVLGLEVASNNIAAYELIFVNDASTDRSLGVLLDAARDHDDIRIINMSRNFGVSPCVLAGLDYADADLVVYMDVDMQDPPEVIAEMLQAWREQGCPDVVHTIRRSRGGETRVKLALTWLGYRILSRLSSTRIRIEAGDFKLLSRRVVRELRLMREKLPFMRGLVAWVGFKQIEIHYDRQPRCAGRTKFPVLGMKVISNFLDSALIAFSNYPLKMAILTGLLVSCGALILLIHVIVQKALGHNIPGWSAIMVAMLFLGGTQMFFLGMMGLYINAIFLESKNRPNYIVESTFGFSPEREKTLPRP